MCGFMNEYMQEFMLTRDFHEMNISEEPNPDNMSYEVDYFYIQQLLALGEEIGKVSRGLPKQELEKLTRSKKITGEE